MKNLEEILDEWDKDAPYDITSLTEAASTVDNLHRKYIRYLCEHRAIELKCTYKLERLEKVKLEYYSGRMSQEELNQRGWVQFQLRLKSDIPRYIQSDDEIISIREKIDYHRTVIGATESILKQISYRNQGIKNTIDWERYTSGG
jgi:hypothetical protein